MKFASRWTSVALAAALAGGLARAQTTERVSVSSSGAQGNYHVNSSLSAISADGRFVAFHGFASNLVAGDTNGFQDVFVRDRRNGTTERVSVSSSGAQGDSHSTNASISPDGRFVAFESLATNLVAGDTNGFQDVFVHDRLSGTTERVSVGSGGVQGNNLSYCPSLSGDDRFVAFTSLATNLVAGDTNGVGDVFVYDRQLGTTQRVSVNSSGVQGDISSGYRGSSLSADGRFVAFDSLATNLVAGDGNSAEDVFVHDRQGGTTELVSVAAFGGGGTSGSGTFFQISADGRFVAFDSGAWNLVVGDTNGAWDVFVRDRQLGTTERVSVDSGGAQGNSGSSYPSISSDGRFVAFMSDASNLVTGDTNGRWDIFVRDLQSGTTERVSVASGGPQGNNYSLVPSLSADGHFVAFSSAASNLVAGDTGGFTDVFVRDRGVPLSPFCFGDGSAGACPCGNSGLPGAGCENSASTGGAVLGATGSPSLASDTLVLSSSGELPTALSVFLQGTTTIAPSSFGDGLRCTGGALKRLYIRNASGGVVSAPQTGDPSISARSATLGDVLAAGATRYYQTYYRDPVLAFCPNPPGNNWNVSSGLSVVWVQ
jgi:Tol biopolymer transport system component